MPNATRLRFAATDIHDAVPRLLAAIRLAEVEIVALEAVRFGAGYAVDVSVRAASELTLRKLAIRSGQIIGIEPIGLDHLPAQHAAGPSLLAS